MSKSSQRRISRRKPKTKVSIGVIAEFQRRLDVLQISLVTVWQEGFDEGHAWGTGEERGTAIGEPVNPYVPTVPTKAEADEAAKLAGSLEESHPPGRCHIPGCSDDDPMNIPSPIDTDSAPRR